jgi:NADH dehydrogenase
VAIGAAVGWLFRYHERGAAALATGGLTIGLLWWIVGPLTLVPLAGGDVPSWSLGEAAGVFSSLVGALLSGGLTGVFYFFLLPRIGALPWLDDLAASPADPAHVVVLGGGFGGVATARRIEQRAIAGSRLTVSLVSQSNYLLFTPMLAEVVGSSLEAQHISAPVRAACPRTRFYRGEVAAVDLASNEVHLEGSSVGSLRYDHLVFALGSVPNFQGLPGMEEHSFSLKSLHDATKLRNHVIAMLERADVETDLEERRRLLTFVVAGGGFAGTELIAELFDLVHNARRYYAHIWPEDLQFVLVHSRRRILPEIGPDLAQYALRKLRGRGIEVLLGVRVAGATSDAMQLADGTAVPTRTLVWTAGNQPNPLLDRLPVERDSGGAVLVDGTLRLLGSQNLWAVGDCALIPDPLNEGYFYPPTAQHALREGRAVADNIDAVERGRPPEPFRFKAIGTLVALGHRTAVAEIRGRRFSGLLAWMLWRGVYLSKLPGLEKKVRVLIDWTIDLLFPRDIVLTAESPPAASAINAVGDRRPA